MHPLSHQKPPLAALAIGLMSLIRRRESPVSSLNHLFRPVLLFQRTSDHLSQRFPALAIDRQFLKAAHQRFDQQSHRQERLPV